MKIRKRAGIITIFGMFAVFAVLMVILYHYKLDSLGRVQVMQVAMDVFGMSLGIILFIFCINDRDDMNGLKLSFLRLLTVVYVGLFVDAAVWVTGGHQEARSLSIALDTMVYLANPLTTYSFFSYVKELVGTGETRYGKLSDLVMRIGFLTAVLIRIVNLFYPLYFFYDEAGVYHRGAYYGFSNIYSYFGGVVTILLMIRFRKKLRINQFFALIAFIAAPLAAVAVNVAFFGLTPAFAVMMTALTILYIVLNVDRTRASSVVQAELSMANGLQRAMLPNLLPEVTQTREYDLYACMNPAKEVGGNFYDFFMIDDHTLAFLVADVSDKGVGAALFMAVSKSMIKMRAQAGGGPAEVLIDVDEKIAKNNELGMFVTIWLGYLDLNTGHVRACNAGHDYPARYLQKEQEDGQEGYSITETENGPAVGLIPGMDFPEIEFDMEPGDRIFLYTDGVNEAQGRSGEQFGFDRLISVLNNNLDQGSETICRSVKEAVDAFVGDDPQFDDMTMLALTYRGPGEDPVAEEKS